MDMSNTLITKITLVFVGIVKKDKIIGKKNCNNAKIKTITNTEGSSVNLKPFITLAAIKKPAKKPIDLIKISFTDFILFNFTELIL